MLKSIVQDWFVVGTSGQRLEWVVFYVWLFSWKGHCCQKQQPLLSICLRQNVTHIGRHTDKQTYCLCNVTQVYRAICAQHTIILLCPLLTFQKMFFTELPGQTDICLSHLSKSLTHTNIQWHTQTFTETHKQGWKHFSTWFSSCISVRKLLFRLACL